MALSSMTGFARADGELGGANWYWEVRTVNGRGLDVRIRLAHGFDGLEKSVREICTKQFNRGNCHVNLYHQRQSGSTSAQLNELALKEVMTAVDRTRELYQLPVPSVEGILALRGVLEIVENTAVDDDELEQINTAILENLRQALAGVTKARSEEGARLEDVIRVQLDDMAELVDAIESSPARSPDVIQARLKDQLDRILKNSNDFDEQRLYLEAVLLAAKADVEEEIARFRSHLTAVHELLVSDQPIGRKLDFLAQEFNREANTICSKSNDANISRNGLALKSTIEQFREQVQNVE